MGLDMFLYQRKKNGGKEAELTEVMYWRKANAVHGWFLEKTNTAKDFNCGEIKVDMELLKLFIKEGRAVLANRMAKEPDVEKLFMPTRSGFFFGGTEYDEYYYDSIERTVEKFEELVENFNFFENELIYSCWW